MRYRGNNICLDKQMIEWMDGEPKMQRMFLPTLLGDNAIKITETRRKNYTANKAR